MSKILVVVDMQKDFVDGALGSEQAQAIVTNVKAKINEYDQCGKMIIFTRDTHHENYLKTQEGKYLPVPHCLYKTNGWQIFDELDKNLNNCIYIDKGTFGYPGWVESGKITEETKEIELIGLCTDICVVTNALLFKTYFPEVKVTVDASCCAGVTEESHKAALLTMRTCQVDVINDEMSGGTGAGTEESNGFKNN